MNMARGATERMRAGGGRRGRRGLRALLTSLVGVAALGAGLAGCVGYHTYPRQEGFPTITDPNTRSMTDPMTEALDWVIRRYPPGDAEAFQESSEPIAINLPEGINRMVYESVARRLGENAQPLTPDNERLPTYHVSRVWVRGDEAKVDILRPVTDLPRGLDGNYTTQGITVHLRGGLRPWEITAHRVWNMGTLATPSPNYLPESERIVQPDPAADRGV